MQIKVTTWFMSTAPGQIRHNNIAKILRASNYYQVMKKIHVISELMSTT